VRVAIKSSNIELPKVPNTLIILFRITILWKVFARNDHAPIYFLPFAIYCQNQECIIHHFLRRGGPYFEMLQKDNRSSPISLGR
jgi:hypothetical protein